MKKWTLVLTVLLLIVLAGCQSNNTNEYDRNSGSEETISTQQPDNSVPPKYIGVRSLAQLNEMRLMLQRSDEELTSYLLSVEGGGADSREDIENFIDLIDSLPVLELIDGDITWIAHCYNQDLLTGEKHDGVVYISTTDSNGDWTRIEYLLAAKDVSGELEKLRADGQFDKSTISDVVQNKNGRVKVFSEVKEAHSSGDGDTVEWILTIDNTLARMIYYTSDSSEVGASSAFESINLTQVSGLI